MKPLNIIFSVISLVSALSCGRPDSRTSEFKEYLQNSFGIEAKNGFTYLLIPSNQCKNCINLNALNLPKDLADKIIIISALQKKHFKHFKNYYFDEADKMMELVLLDYENKLLLYDNNKVLYVREVELISNADYCKDE